MPVFPKTCMMDSADEFTREQYTPGAYFSKKIVKLWSDDAGFDFGANLAVVTHGLRAVPDTVRATPSHDFLSSYLSAGGGKPPGVTYVSALVE